MTDIQAALYVSFIDVIPVFKICWLIQLLTGYGELMLAEFKYGLEPKESFSFFNQSKPNR